MLPSTLALQQAIFAALTSAPQLLALLGGPRVYDATPQAALFPYVTFGVSRVRDASTSTEAAEEHTITLNIWSRARGRKEAQLIVEALRSVLHDQPLSLTGHHLINLRAEMSDVRREADGVTFNAILHLRALTEPH